MPARERRAAADLLDLVNKAPLQSPVDDFGEFVHLLAIALKESPSKRRFHTWVRYHFRLMKVFHCFITTRGRLCILNCVTESDATRPAIRIIQLSFTAMQAIGPMPDGGPRCSKLIICRYCSGRRGTRESWGMPLKQYSAHFAQHLAILGARRRRITSIGGTSMPYFMDSNILSSYTGRITGTACHLAIGRTQVPDHVHAGGVTMLG